MNIANMPGLGISPLYLRYIAIGLAKRGEIQKALEIINKHLPLEDRLRAYEDILIALAEQQKINDIIDIARKLDQEIYDDVIPTTMISYVENGGRAPIAMKLLEQTKCLGSILEGLIGIATVLVEQRRYEELITVIDKLMPYLRRASRYLLSEYIGVLSNLVEKLVHAKRYKEALYIIEVVRSIDKNLALDLVHKLVRASLTIDDPANLITSLQGCNHLVDQDFIKVIASEAVLKRIRAVLHPDKMYQNIIEAIMCIDREVIKLGDIAKSLARCFNDV